MNEIRDKLEFELNKYEFKTDIENIKEKENHRKRKQKNIAVTLSSIVVVFTVALFVMFLTNSNPDVITNNPTSTNAVSNSHSFFIVASALNSETANPIEVTDDNAQVLDKDMIMIQSRLSYTYFVRGNEKYNGVYDPDDERLEEIFTQEDLTINKGFSFMGQDSMWIEGEDIVKVEYEVQNGTLFKWTDGIQSKSIVLKNEQVYNVEKVVLWRPQGLDKWIEEQNSHNKPVDFSTAPQDIITITATFSDGSVASRKLSLYYNAYGYLVVETEDGTKYNDGELNDYENWYKNVYEYDENGNPIKWDYSGRTVE